ncbi:DoxX family membrane protein [Paracoccus homiensis]|uniref:DoxX family membrane protein n=1 Tax=Paracoccus homiensis TaxID=364199 RepID=UPI00398D15BC
MHLSVKIALLAIRVSFGLFLLVWGLNKFVNPEGTSGIFAKFYGIEGLGAASSMIAGGLQVALSVAIILGLFKTITYGTGLAIHAVSTLATASHILLPLAEGSNLLFMAGLPILGAIFGLFVARRDDTLLALDNIRTAKA